MFKQILLIVALVAASLQLNATNKLSTAQKAAIVARFGTEAKYNFAHFRIDKSQWDSIWMARLPQIAETPSDEAFLDSLRLLCASLRDGHTAVWCSNQAVPNFHLPFFTKRYGDRVFVTHVITDKMLAAGLHPGTEILEIEDIPVIEYGERNVIPYLPSSTPQWSQSFAFLNGTLTTGPFDQPMKVKLRNAPDSVFTLSIDRDINWNHNPYDTWHISYRELPGGVGYIKIPSFEQGIFSHDDFSAAFNALAKASSLIIDLRDNGGGNSGNGDFVMRLICSDTIQTLPWSSPGYVPVLKAWGQPEASYTEDGDTLVPFSMERADVPEYGKPVALLVNSNSFSATEDFAALFRANKRGLIIGTPTGGSTGQPISVNLGYGYVARFCARDEWLPDGTKFIGVGIIPDIIAEETAEIFDGHDAVLDRALDHLAKQTTKNR